MHEHKLRASPVVVQLPDEIDVTNADGVGERLRAAFAPGITVVVADLTATVFCDSSGIRNILSAHDHGLARGAQLRLAVSSPAVLRVLNVMGLQRILRIYPTLDTALAV